MTILFMFAFDDSISARDKERGTECILTVCECTTLKGASGEALLLPRGLVGDLSRREGSAPYYEMIYSNDYRMTI